MPDMFSQEQPIRRLNEMGASSIYERARLLALQTLIEAKQNLCDERTQEAKFFLEQWCDRQEER